MTPAAEPGSPAAWTGSGSAASRCTGECSCEEIIFTIYVLRQKLKESKTQNHKSVYIYFRISFKPLPEREHNDDIVVAVVQILVADYAEHDDHVEDDDQGGGGAVAAHPGPGHAPPLPLTGPGAWLQCLLHLWKQDDCRHYHSSLCISHDKEHDNCLNWKIRVDDSDPSRNWLDNRKN